MVGWVSTDDHHAAGLVQLLQRADRLRQLHQRQDPLLHARAAGGRDGDERQRRPPPRCSQARANFSPTTLPIEPPMNEKSITASRHGCDSIRAVADDHRVAEARRDLGLGEALRVGLEVEEVERVARAEIDVRPPRSCPRRPAARSARRPDREMVAALRADAEVRLQLLVAIVRTAVGHVLGCFLAVPSSSVGRLCSIETSILSVADICAILDPPSRNRVTGRPRRRAGASAPTSASSRKPVKPEPRQIGSRPDDVAEELLRLGQRRTTRLGHEDRELAGSEHVAVERHVDAVAARRGRGRGRRRSRSPRGTRARAGRGCGRRRGRRPRGSTAPASIAIRSGIPHALPGGRATRACSGRRGHRARRPRAGRRARREAANRTDVRSSSTRRARAGAQAGCGSAPRPDPRASPPRSSQPPGYGQREQGRVGHRLAAVAPGARDADESGRVLAAAAVALVLVVDRDGRERAAVRAAGAQRAHAVAPTCCSAGRRAARPARRA